MAIKIKRPIKFVYGFGNKVGFIVPPSPTPTVTASPTPTPSATPSTLVLHLDPLANYKLDVGKYI